MTKRINVTTTSYEGSDFPEAANYCEYVAAELGRIYDGFEIDVSEGPETKVFVYGAENDGEVADEVSQLVRTSLWDDFCEHGYKDFSAEAR
ncbi:MAG TPA: hypothetical protein VFB66_03845 [Tepidisphaeraceae bacterium]|nr:hypothetical protein [Tepidisphaeraceae bacterium]